jgi:hypothetical protein
MRLTDVPSAVERSHGYPITHDDLRQEFGALHLEVPEGPDRSLSTLLDECADGGFADAYETAEDLRSTLLCRADADHVGRAGYDDRGGNPGRADGEQVSF